MSATASAPACMKRRRSRTTASPGHGPRLQKNMTIAVEPMVNAGDYEVRVLDNGWTVVTADGSLSAHYENSLLVTDGEPEILTFADDM